ncbi:MAG: rhodanese-like domain-containing protein [Spirochaetia bacterium]|jgi:rhodanese-related sulfurtransferase|nr:rhodanese-like domain-containing protein [Spirochaetia bacterium]
MKLRYLPLIGVLFLLSCAKPDAAGNQTAALPARIDYETLRVTLQKPGANVLILDVRTKEEFDGGHLPGAVLIPYDVLGSNLSEPDKKRPIVVYCRSGRRSGIAATTLVEMGYESVFDLGGINAWKGSLER